MYPLPPDRVHFVALNQANTMMKSVDPSNDVGRWDKGKIEFFMNFAYKGHVSKRRVISIAPRLGAFCSPEPGVAGEHNGEVSGTRTHPSNCS